MLVHRSKLRQIHTKRQSAIDTRGLTAVLRDAIFVAKTLSIPDIWVDSLCILQYDISDWEQQCLEVAAIYGNAYVTITAASSTSCLEGFLKQRGLRIRLPFQSAPRQAIAGPYDLQFKGVTEAILSHNLTERNIDLVSCRWSRRGWTFQESMSSTRQLILGNSNIHFDCGGYHTTMGDNVPHLGFYDGLLHQIEMEVDHTDLGPETEILHAETVLHRSNQFGAIKEAWLMIRSSVLDLASLSQAKLAITVSGERRGWLLSYDRTLVVHFQLDFNRRIY